MAENLNDLEAWATQESKAKKPLAELLTPLADYSRQALQVGTPPGFVFDANGRPANKDLLQLSLQLRIAEALERVQLHPTNKWLTTQVPIGSPKHEAYFRQLVAETAAEWNTKLLVVCVKRGVSEQTLVAELLYLDGAALFRLGKMWDSYLAEEGGQADV